MHRVNLLRFSDVDWSSAESRARARAEERGRKALWQLRLLRWRSQYARLAFVVAVGSTLLSSGIIWLVVPERPFMAGLLLWISSALVWADTAKRLFSDHQNGFFEPRQD